MMEFHVLDLSAVLLLSANVVIALIGMNIHSALGWGYGVFMYIVFMNYRDANCVLDDGGGNGN